MNHTRFQPLPAAFGLLILTPLLLGSSHAQSEPKSAEIRIDRDVIVPEFLERPNPQGMVDDNPPWFHVVVPLVEGERSNAERREIAGRLKWQRRFHFRLSKDREFQSGVIESGPKRWSFWNPLRVLENGEWFWQYGVADPGTPDMPIWNTEVFSFLIRGDERVVAEQPPSAEEVLVKLKAIEGPIVAMRAGQIGKLLPTDTWPELAREMKKTASRALENDRMMTKLNFDMSMDDVPERLKSTVTEPFFAVRGRKYWVEAERHTSALLQGYLIAGDREMLERGIKRAIELEQARLTVVWKLGGHVVRLRDAAIYDSVASSFVDSFWDEIPEEHREMFLNVVREKVMDAGRGGLPENWRLNGPKFHERLEHVHYDQHDWQYKVKDLINGTVMLVRHDPEFEEWFKYAYELWLYRNPAMSRDDGGCREGNGYFGVHEHQLVHCGWLLYQITGYNYFLYKPWFENFGKHLAYAKPAGNPGQGFSDGGNEGASMSYVVELLAHLCPENAWNLWCFKTVGRRDAAYFAKDMSKGEKAWDMLSVWREFKTPDVSEIPPPEEPAAVFPDVGFAAMHTDMANAADNLMVNFHSSPYGSSTHGHPSQNAFNIASGGQPLFWRSGYYNGGNLHNVFSYKASSAHNTIMPDFTMQGFDMSAYGWLPRFATGQRISYCLGDATHAYNGVHHYGGGNDLLDQVNGRHNGCHDVGMTRFRRHVVMLRPSHVVIYDELAAKDPIPWTFRLHGHQEMKLLENGFALGQNDHAYGTVQMFCDGAIESDITDQFYGPATDEENKRGGANPPMWHLNMTTKDRLAATRFLTVIEITPGKPVGFAADPRLARREDGKFTLELGGYEVIAQMDPARESLLSIRSADGRAVLSTGQASEKVMIANETRNAALKGSTLLWEKPSGGDETFCEVVDQLPDVLRFGNIY